MFSKARLFALALTLTGGAVLAQEGTYVSSAIIAFKRPDLAEAQYNIDKADSIIATKSIDDVRESTAQKFYYYKGLIYLSLNELNPSAQVLETAIKSFNNLIQYDIRVDDDEFMNDATISLTNSISNLSKMAEDAYFDERDAQKAYDLHSLSFKYATEMLGKVDTLTQYNLARIAAELENREASIEHYNYLIENNYQGRVWKAYYNGNTEQKIPMPDKATLDYLIREGKATDPELSPSINYSLYLSVAMFKRELGDTAGAMEVLAKGLEANPGNNSLSNTQLQFLLDAGDYEEALSNFETALESDPTNPIYLYNAGFIQQTKLNNTEKALEYYDRCLAADSANTGASYMAGYVYIDKANELTEKMNALPRSAKSQYDRLLEERKGLYEKALSYFEKAYNVDQKDINTLKAMREVYFKLGNAAKVGEFTQKMSELE